MKRHSSGYILKHIILIPAAFILLGILTMLLLNNQMPAIAIFAHVNFYQAAGLFFLTWLIAIKSSSGNREI